MRTFDTLDYLAIVLDFVFLALIAAAGVLQPRSLLHFVSAVGALYVSLRIIVISWRLFRSDQW